MDVKGILEVIKLKMLMKDPLVFSIQFDMHEFISHNRLEQAG